MLSLSPAVRIFLCLDAVDLRKSFDGLSALVSQALGDDPLSGHWFVFRNRRGDRLMRCRPGWQRCRRADGGGVVQPGAELQASGDRAVGLPA